MNSNSLLCDDLVFLLDDLVDKVKHRLPPSTKRSCGFLKAGFFAFFFFFSVISQRFCNQVQSHNVLRFQRLSALDEVSLFNRCVKLLPSLLHHLDSCKNYFKVFLFFFHSQRVLDLYTYVNFYYRLLSMKTTGLSIAQRRGRVNRCLFRIVSIHSLNV